MSEGHGEIELQRPIGEYAQHLKNILPANIPETYALKPMFAAIAGEEDIRKGILAFRDFLYIFFDRLIAEGDLYAQPQKTKNPTDYPFLTHINRLLTDIGNHGAFTDGGEALLLTDIPAFTAPKGKIPAAKQILCLRLLALCGFVFRGMDLDAKAPNISPAQPLEAAYPANPALLTGLKALSLASGKLWVRFLNNAHDLLRCDYRVIRAEEPDVLEILRDVLHPLPEELQRFALDLHQRYTGMGLTCATLSDNEIHFAYAHIGNSKRAFSTREIYQQRIWEFGISMKYGYCLTVRAKKTDKYGDSIEGFPPYLREKIAQGYGCDRKLRGEPCQGGCQGIRIPLDDRALAMKQDIRLWLDNEMPQAIRP